MEELYVILTKNNFDQVLIISSIGCLGYFLVYFFQVLKEKKNINIFT